MQVTRPTNKETNAVCEVQGITVDFSKDFGLSFRYQLPHIGNTLKEKYINTQCIGHEAAIQPFHRPRPILQRRRYHPHAQGQGKKNPPVSHLISYIEGFAPEIASTMFRRVLTPNFILKKNLMCHCHIPHVHSYRKCNMMS